MDKLLDWERDNREYDSDDYELSFQEQERESVKPQDENDVKNENTYAINNSITGMVQNNEGPEDLKVSKNGLIDARKKKKVKKKNGVKKKTESM